LALSFEPRRAALAVGIVAATAAVFAPVLGYDWLNYDDPIYVTDNPAIRLGLSPEAVAWAFSNFHGANWFPLTWLSWMLDYEIRGMQPAVFHGTSVLLHMASAGVLFAALTRLTGCALRSAFVAAVFAVHPLHVESVAWIAARKDPLSGLFFFLAILAYAPPVHREGGRRMPWVFVWMALSLMAKPIAVTLPFVLLLLDAWPLRRLQRLDGAGWDATRIRSAVVEKLPLFALTAVAGIVTVMAQSSGGALASLDQASLGSRLANALVAYTGYLGKAFWPTELAVFYPHQGELASGARVAFSAIGLVATTALAAVAARRQPAVLVGWLWYLGTLVPVIGLVQVGSQAMADRYMYLPLVGLALAVAWGVPALLPDRAWRGRALAALAIGVIAALCGAASLQVRHWRDSESLFRHALAVTEDNHVAHAYLGDTLLAQGRTSEALPLFREAVRLRPDFLSATNNLAWVLATVDDDELRNPYLAVSLAQRAAGLTGGRDPAVLDTLAAAYAVATRPCWTPWRPPTQHPDDSRKQWPPPSGP